VPAHRSPLPAVRARCALLALVVAGTVLGAGGCGKDGFEDRTARVTIGEKTTSYVVDSCGLDGRTLFVVARSDGGSVLQAVVGLKADRRTGIPASTGLTVARPATEAEYASGDDSRVAYGAFGAESWARRGRNGSPPGHITSARLRGSRIQVGGDAVRVDPEDRPVGGSSSQRVSIDVRCDQKDD
jgi:hypothetical protein